MLAPSLIIAGALLRSLTIAGEARVPLANATTTRFVVFRDMTGSNSIAVVIGKPDLSNPVPVRLHSACLTGDVFGSRRCDCGDQLQMAISKIEAVGGGVVLYLAQEGRGLGLVNKMRAYELQDEGLDTVDANTTLGFDDDERDYGIAGRMLEMLDIKRVRLMTNNPTKLAGLASTGIEVVGRMPVEAPDQFGQPPLPHRKGRARWPSDRSIDRCGSQQAADTRSRAVTTSLTSCL